MRIPISGNQTTAGFSHMDCCISNFRLDRILMLLKFIYFVDNAAKYFSTFFLVVRVHLAEQHDPFGHTRPIGRRLSMAGLEYQIT